MVHILEPAVVPQPAALLRHPPHPPQWCPTASPPAWTLGSATTRWSSSPCPLLSRFLSAVVPNGIATGLDIGFSNYSLVFITLSFYVMCKSTTPLFLLFFAIAWGIEKPSWCERLWLERRGRGGGGSPSLQARPAVVHHGALRAAPAAFPSRFHPASRLILPSALPVNECRSLAAVVSVISAGLLLLVYGETKFHLVRTPSCLRIGLIVCRGGEGV